MNKKILLRVSIVTLYVTLLVVLADTLSLAYFEVSNYYDQDNSILYYPLHLFTQFFGENDLVLRSFMMVLHLLSLYFYFAISRHYLEKERDKLWNIIIFILLPAIVSSAIIVHPSGLILLLLLFFIYAYMKWETKALVLLPLYLFVDISFFILFFGLFVHFLTSKRWYLMTFQLLLMTASIMIFGFIAKGSPINYFVHTLGVASLVFSPMLFIYYLYTLIRVGFKGHKDLIWTISAVAFILMLLLSIRQRILIEHFAPYFILLLPLMIKQFMHTYRMRVRSLRKNYKILFVIAIMFLLINSLSVYLNKYLYYVLQDPEDHFLYKHYVAKDLAKTLKSKGLTHIHVNDEYLQLRLKFYGITDVNATHILEEGSCQNVTLSYNDIKIASFCVTKFNTDKNN